MTKKIAPEISNKIANMSFVCALLVVLIHFPHGDAGAVGWFYNYFPGSLRYMSVPFFFTVSGYLLAGRFDEAAWWRDALGKRFHTLLVPYVVLNTLFGAWILVQHNLLGPKLGIAPMPMDFQTIVGLIGFHPMGHGPANAPLWYVRALLLFVLLSPLLKCLVARLGSWSWAFIVLLGALSVPVMERFGYFFQYFFPLFGVAYFMAGMWLRKVRAPEGDWRVGLLALAAGVGLNCFLGESAYCRAMTNPLVIIGMWSLTPAAKWSKALTGNAFPIYVFHAVIIHFMLIGVRRVGAADLLNTSLCLNLVGVFAVVGVSITVAIAIRMVGVLSRFVLGGR